VILLQVNPVSSNEFEIIYKGFYENEDISVLHSLQFPALDITIGCTIRFIDFF